MITKFTCTCGTTDTKHAYAYDGAMGYEAIVCKRCGRFYDHDGAHKADEWSKQYIVPGAIKNSLQDTIKHYNNLLNERVTLKGVYPYRTYYSKRSCRNANFHQRRIAQLRRQVDKNIKRVENVIEKLW